MQNQNSTYYLIQVAFTLAIGFYVVKFLRETSSRHRLLPPGPPLEPIFGNARIFPRSRPHIQFSSWAKQYGDVFSLKVFDKTMIVLNSPTAVREVFEKHGNACSNRPSSVIADMVTPHNMNLGTGRFANATWRALRKSAGQLVNAQNMRRHQPYQYAEATQFMWDVLHKPDGWYEHIQRFTTSYFLGVIYGKRTPHLASPDCADFLHVQPRFMHALELGTMPPVDIFPILKYVPARFAPWKREVNEIRHLQETLYGRLLSDVEDRMKEGILLDVFMEKAIQNADEWGLNREMLMNLGGTLLEGSDTSSATMQYIIMLLVAFPHVQAKLHSEIDEVVGSQRAPRWDDIPNLPYMAAFIEEAQRFRPVANLGLPHEMVHDEIINGQLYPKDAVLFMNLYHIFSDEKYFDRPHEFMPERFLKNSFGVKPEVADDPARRDNLLFGAGRRVCPGIIFAKTSLQLLTMSVVWAFNLGKAIDRVTGKEVPLDMNNIASGITATPLKFNCTIEPRSQAHAELINNQFHSVAEHLRVYEYTVSAADRAFNTRYRD